MRRLALAVAVLAALAVPAAPAAAHPLGNFSVNHLSVVRVSADRVDVRYVLDQAEIPTAQERGLGRAEVLRRKLAEVSGGLELEVDGRKVALEPAGAPRLSFPEGAGGLPTTRLELALTAAAERRAPGRSAGRHLPRPGGLEGRGGGARPRHRGPQQRAERRSHRRPAPLPAGSPEEPGRPA